MITLNIPYYCNINLNQVKIHHKLNIDIESNGKFLHFKRNIKRNFLRKNNFRLKFSRLKIKFRKSNSRNTEQY